jgi:hypothetical protein
MQIQPFNVAVLQRIYKECNVVYDDLDAKKVSKERYLEIFDPVIKYVKTYYFESSAGNYYFFDVTKDEFTFKDQKDFKKEVSDKLENDAFNRLFKCNNQIYSCCSRLDKPRTFQDSSGNYFFNECKGFLHKSLKPYADYSEALKRKVEMILQMIKEISCNNNAELFEAYKKYLSQICKGQKTEVIIYKKSGQGTGKSTESEFFMNHVLGKDICLIATTEPLLKDYNKILMGKLYVVFEELPTFNSASWSAVSSKLKTLTTEKMTTYRDLFKSPFQAENISNFAINTNVEALRDSDGRRIIILPISNSRVNDFEYFENIRKQCFNNNVGEAFYSYMLEIDTNGFYAQKDFPETENKSIARAKLLDPVYKFIKFEYVLKNKPILKIKPKDLYDLFLTYCDANQIDRKIGIVDFKTTLENVNIKQRKISVNIYRESIEDLKAIAEKYKWCCSYDELDEDEEKNNDPFITVDDDEVDYKALYNKQKLEIKELKTKLSLLAVKEK